MKLGQMEVSIGNHQDIGARKEQQDYFGTIPDGSGGYMLVVADGMGGHEGGAQASVIAVDAFTEALRSRDRAQDRAEVLGHCVRVANDAVVAAASASGADMGTTLVACWVSERGFQCVSVGDSVAILCRAESVLRLNRQHTLGAEMDRGLATGAVNTADARRREGERAHLTAYLGQPRLADVDITSPQSLKAGDSLVLASDGLTDALSDGDIARIVSQAADADAACHALVKATLIKERPAQDNVSVVVFRVAGAAVAATASSSPRRWLGAALALVAVLLLLVAFWPSRKDGGEGPVEPVRVHPDADAGAKKDEKDVGTGGKNSGSEAAKQKGEEDAAGDSASGVRAGDTAKETGAAESNPPNKQTGRTPDPKKRKEGTGSSTGARPKDGGQTPKSGEDPSKIKDAGVHDSPGDAKADKRGDVRPGRGTDGDTRSTTTGAKATDATPAPGGLTQPQAEADKAGTAPGTAVGETSTGLHAPPVSPAPDPAAPSLTGVPGDTKNAPGSTPGPDVPPGGSGSKETNSSPAGAKEGAVDPPPGTVTAPASPPPSSDVAPKTRPEMDPKPRSTDVPQEGGDQ
ncbi:MAG: hypothetical protein AMXMBFR64_25170 [Myxococcales bacterium]